MAAAPDVLPPANFNSGVMVIRPSTQVFETMKKNAKHLTTYDGSDTGYLNAYYPTWFQDFPPDARLPVGYNAQTALYEMTADPKTGESSFWDAQLVHDLHIIHYSEAIKPWQVKETDSQTKKNSLHELWKSWHQKSKNFLLRDKKERAKEEKERLARQQLLEREAIMAKAAAAKDPKRLHKLVAMRYKELRAEGLSTQEAMQQARQEYQPDGGAAQLDPGAQVAAMFGMR